MTIPSLPARPTRGSANFSADFETFLAAINPWGDAANALAASMSAIAAGGALLNYIFSTTTTDSDPGPGVLRLNQAAQNTSTVIRADLADSAGVDMTAMLDSFAASGSAVKGYLNVTKASSVSSFLLFYVTAVASPGGYRNITVTPVASSSANPFANGDALYMSFTRAGDVGQTGPMASSDVQLFSSSGTWTKPGGTPKFVMVELLGAGGGGGSGALDTNTANYRGGGAGGGGGARVTRFYAVSELPATVTVTVGAGGNGGAAVTGTGVGNSGAVGGTTTFGTMVSAYGGGGGYRGATTASGAGAVSGGGGGGLASAGSIAASESAPAAMLMRPTARACMNWRRPTPCVPRRDRKSVV